jgi:pyridoxal 5'-phosphate synthase pdxS subunit
VEAVSQFDKPDVIARVSAGLGEAMVGINISDIPDDQKMAQRGW